MLVPWFRRKPLIAALADGNDDVRRAARTLGEIGDPDARQAFEAYELLASCGLKPSTHIVMEQASKTTPSIEASTEAGLGAVDIVGAGVAAPTELLAA